MLRQLSSLDAQFLAIESQTHYGHVGGLVIVDPSTLESGRLTLEDLSAGLSERLHMLPVMRWKLAEVPLGLDRPYWIEDPDFDLEYHMREIALPPPGDDHRLAEQVCRISSRHLDRSRPLWELYLIQGLEGGRVGILTKMHHAMIDGMSGAEIMGVLYDLEPSGREIPPVDPDHENGAGEAPSSLEMLGRGLVALPMQPLRTLRALPNDASAPGCRPLDPRDSRGGGDQPLRVDTPATLSAPAAMARSSSGRATGPRTHRSAAGSRPTAGSASARCRSRR